MLCVTGLIYTVHFTAFCLGGRFLPGHGVDSFSILTAAVDKAGKTFV